MNFNDDRAIYPLRCFYPLGKVFLWFLICTASLQAQSADVPLYHPVYIFLEKLESYLPNRALDLHVKPVNREQVRQIMEEAAIIKQKFSRADVALIEQYLSEFTDPPVGAPKPRGAERNFLRYEERGAQIFVDLFALQRFEIHRGDQDEDDLEISRTRAGGRMRAHLPPQLLVAVDLSNILERGTPDTSEVFDPGSGAPLVLSGESVFRESAIAYGRLKLPWFELEAGRNFFSWNLGPLSQMTLTTENQPLNLVRLDARWKKFRFIFAHADLRSQIRKYLAAHRLEFMPFSNFLFGVGETVIYGDRPAEFLYLNPFMLYHAAEHLLGDKDNNVLTLDFSYFPFAGTKFYGEIFIDDLSLEYPLGTYYGNKLAWLAGIYWAQPFHWRTGDLRLEYARIDPFVYTHEKPENVYEQDGESLGARFGPNAERYLLNLGFQPHRDVRFAGQLRFQRKGRGDLFEPHTEEDGTSKGFLKGTTINTFAVHLEIEDQVRRDVYVGLEFDWERQQNGNFEAGVISTRRQAVFTLRIDF